VGSFEEPDALLPFQIDRRAAAQAVHQRLAPELRPEIERGDLTAVYLPFWSFEGMVLVMLPLTAEVTAPCRPGLYTVQDALVSGVKQPHESVLAELLPFDLRALVAYDPRYLAQWPAQIYSIDVIQASITGRAYLKHAARQQATGYSVPEVELARTGSRAYSVPNSSLWQIAQVETQALNYRLILLPVWMVTLILRSGQRRPAVVNGQTGEAIVSASFLEPERVIARRNVIRPLPPRR
jgi:hypothetical protein